MRIWFRTHTFHQCSWTVVWNYLRKAFNQLGAKVIISPQEPRGDYVELLWGNPADWNFSGRGPKVGMALSEARSLPARKDVALANLRQCDFLICPSRSATIAFLEAPLDIPVFVVPFGVDTDEMRFVDRPLNGKLRFLLAGAAQKRKGTRIGIDAFIEAFKWRSRVELVVWSSTNTPDRELLEKEYGHVRSIVFDETVYGTSFEIYRKCDVLLSPHLSEGFGLQPLEAMATGMPCIVARCSAPREYFSSDFGWWIEMSESYIPVSDCLPEIAGTWRLPSVDSLAKQMRYVYSHRREAKGKGEAAAAYVRAQMKWTDTALGICNILEEHFGYNFIGDNANTQRREATTAFLEAAGGCD